jgi:FlgD Ig-like domain
LINSIGPNTGLGIDLGDDGVTANDALDADTGPNSLQNFPVLTSIVQEPSGLIDVIGTLNSTPSTNFKINFFRSSTCNASGYGEGEVNIAAVKRSTDATGSVAFTLLGLPNMPGGSYVTAIADPYLAGTGTSEFSACLQFNNTPTGSNVVVVPVDEGSGANPITLTFDDVSGTGNVLLSTGSSGPPPPNGYTFGDMATYYDLTTTASYSGNIQVCFTYADSMVTGPESDLKLFHYDDSLVPPDWVDITTSVDTLTNTLCGTTTTLSPFAVGAPIQPTGVGNKPAALPTSFALYPNAPNPFNPETTIRYDVPAGGARVSIVVYDIAGRRVRTLLDSNAPAGGHSVVWDGRDEHGQGAASGVYFCRMIAGSFVQTRKMVLLK